MNTLYAPYDRAMHPVQQQPPPAPRSRAVWIIAGAIVLAAAIIAIAITAVNGRRSEPTAATSTAPAAPASAASSATCAAWRATVPALRAVPDLPAGWDWSTPNIDTLINSSREAANAAIDLFEPRIADEPADVAAAARAFVSAKRKEWDKLADHTYTAADGVAGNVAGASLDELCGVKG